MNQKIEKLVENLSEGIKIIPDDSEGGNYGYSTADAPNIMTVGFKTREEAYRHWLKSRLGEKIANAIVELISES